MTTLYAMHLPDGLVDTRCAALLALVAALTTLHALWRWRLEATAERSALLAVVAAGVFAAQMVNFPILPAGCSGHLLGGVLAAVLLGPWGGALAITIVLLVQCLLFGDGGLLALGPNVVNMALLGSSGGYALYAFFRQRLPGGQSPNQSPTLARFSLTGSVVVAAALASWLMVPLAALACSLELATLGDVALVSVARPMLYYHLLIGLGESVITATTIAAVVLTMPQLLYRSSVDRPRVAERHSSPAAQQPQLPRRGRLLLVGLAVSAAVAIFVAPWASQLDDGLEAVASELGILERAEEVGFSPFPDYALTAQQGQLVAERLPDSLRGETMLAAATTGLLGTLGVLVTCGVALGITRLAQRRTPSPLQA